MEKTAEDDDDRPAAEEEEQSDEIQVDEADHVTTDGSTTTDNSTAQQQNDDSTIINGSRINKNHLRPNRELTNEEKSQKRGLKRLLKRQTRRRKLEIRLRQAIMRKDSVTEEISRKELEQFLREEDNELLKTQSLLISSADQQEQTPESSRKSYQQEAQARNDIEHLYQRYYKMLQQEQTKQQKQLQENGNPQNKDTSAYDLDAFALKEKQTAEARLLLMNMTKGTQQVHMFENQSALVGYVRQKFQERACLSISSLCKLDPQRRLPQKQQQEPPSSLEIQQQQLNDKVWNQLLSARSICSIGCGPGCDAIGNITFLQHFARTTTTTTILDRVVFLDWTMDKWKFFLQPLIDQVMLPNKFLTKADLAFCDVLKSLNDSSNAEAKRLLLHCSDDDDNHGDDENSTTTTIDLFVTSYLLTECRDKWQAFYSDIIDIAKPGTLLLFAEPTAWQLHKLVKMATNVLDFVWLDSSMHSPILQALEGRVGPAVVIGMKRAKQAAKTTRS